MFQGITNTGISGISVPQTQKGGTVKTQPSVFQSTPKTIQLLNLYDENCKAIEQIKNYYSVKSRDNSYQTIIGRKALNAFKNKYGEIYSPSMEQLRFGPNFKNSPAGMSELMEIRHEILNTPYDEQLDKLEQIVKKEKIANCSEMASLIQKELMKMGIKSSVINFEGKTHRNPKYHEYRNNHCAVIIGGEDSFYKDDIYNCPDELIKNKTVIDPWLGGIFDAANWKKAVEKLYNETNEHIDIKPKYSKEFNLK